MCVVDSRIRFYEYDKSFKFYSLATHALMKHSELPSVPEKTATEKSVAFLPTFVPKSKKRGRFILAAASNGWYYGRHEDETRKITVILEWF